MCLCVYMVPCLEVAMSSAKFTSVLKSAKLRQNDRIWLGRWMDGWMDGYRKSCGVGPNARVPVQRDSVIAMLRGQKAKGGEAWQRLQIVKAIEYYRNTVLRTAEPDLGDLRDVLAQAAQRE